MRLLTLLLAVIMLVGCKSSPRIDRSTLDQRYQETQLAEGTLSIVPMRLAPNAEPPVVVNWWYAGTSNGEHHLVYRELTWGSDQQPVGQEQRYRVAADDLKIDEPFAHTKDAARWLHLHEAAAGEIKPPTDLSTARKSPKPLDSNPIQLPSEPVVPQLD